MKLLVLGNIDRVRKYQPQLPVVQEVEVAAARLGTPNSELLSLAADADFILADAICPIDSELMGSMPNLKLVHSEGVAFNMFDCGFAHEHGIYVCNNRGVNAVAVAEQTLLLMLGICKHVVEGDRAVRSGRQIELKEQLMVSGIDELGGATVGLVGFGDIAREVAKRCRAFGMSVLYNKRNRLSAGEEEALGVEYRELEDLLRSSDFVSIHCPVTPQTQGMCDDAFFSQMKEGSYFVNTARGEIVVNAACVRALESGKLAGAAFDTVAPEPVAADNPLVALPEHLKGRVLYSPHIGGVTSNMFRRAHRCVWENIARVAAGKRPVNIVNGL